MSGTPLGGKRAAVTNRARHGKDFYREIGAKGGRNGHRGGFAVDVWCECPIVERGHYKRQCAGTIGGRVSRRGKKGYEVKS